MAKLIDKDALVTEIENLENTYKKCPTRNSYEEGLKVGRLIGYKDALHKIDTLEVKEVDLESEMDSYFETMEVQEHEYIFEDTFQRIAKHFFELGLEAKQR